MPSKGAPCQPAWTGYLASSASKTSKTSKTSNTSKICKVSRKSSHSRSHVPKSAKVPRQSSKTSCKRQSTNESTYFTIGIEDGSKYITIYPNTGSSRASCAQPGRAAADPCASGKACRKRSSSTQRQCTNGSTCVIIERPADRQQLETKPDLKTRSRSIATRRQCASDSTCVAVDPNAQYSEVKPENNTSSVPSSAVDALPRLCHPAERPTKRNKLSKKLAELKYGKRKANNLKIDNANTIGIPNVAEPAIGPQESLSDTELKENEQKVWGTADDWPASKNLQKENVPKTQSSLIPQKCSSESQEPVQMSSQQQQEPVCPVKQQTSTESWPQPQQDSICPGKQQKSIEVYYHQEDICRVKQQQHTESYTLQDTHITEEEESYEILQPEHHKSIQSQAENKPVQVKQLIEGFEKPQSTEDLQKNQLQLDKQRCQQKYQRLLLNTGENLESEESTDDLQNYPLQPDKQRCQETYQRLLLNKRKILECEVSQEAIQCRTGGPQQMERPNSEIPSDCLETKDSSQEWVEPFYMGKFADGKRPELPSLRQKNSGGRWRKIFGCCVKGSCDEN